MFDLEKSIEDWRRQMIAAGVKTPEILNELESHLREEVAGQMRSGLAAQTAFELAVERMGKADLLEHEFKKLGGLKLRLLKKFKRLITRRRETASLLFSDFDASALRSLEFARSEPLRFGHDFIGTEHVLLGLLRMENGIVPRVLQRIGLNTESVRAEIATIIGTGCLHEGARTIPYTPRAKQALLLATEEAKALQHKRVSPEHILLGLLREGSGVAALVLNKLGVNVQRMRAEILNESGPT